MRAKTIKHNIIKLVPPAFIAGAVLLVSSLLLSSALVSTGKTSALDGDPTTTESISLSTTSLNLELRPVVNTPSFTAGDITTTVSSTNVTGYNLYITSSTKLNNETTNALVHSDGEHTLPTLTTSASEAAFPADYWGYRISGGNTTVGTSTSYSGIETVVSSNSLIDSPTEAISSTNPRTTTLTFAAKADTDQTAGVYTGTILFTAIAKYAPPASGTVTISSPDPTEATEGDSVDLVLSTTIPYDTTISATTVKLVDTADTSDNTKTYTCGTTTNENNSGYLKVSCTAPDTVPAGTYNATLTVTVNNGPSSNPTSSTYTQDYTSTNTIEYVSGMPQFYKITTMQQMTNAICQDTNLKTPAASATAVSTASDFHDDTSHIPQVVLTDQRDGNKYVVRKLADGNCWMVSDLDYHGPNNSELPSSFTLSGSDGLSNYSGTDLTFSQKRTYNYVTAYYDRYNSTDDYYYTDGTTATTTAPSDEAEALMRKGGTLYNWSAAIAGNGQGTINGINMNTQYNTAPYSICPAGWQLPHAGGKDGSAYSGTKSWRYLITTTYGYSSNDSNASSTAGGTTLLNGPIHLNRTGYFYNGKFSNRGSAGYYWSSTVQADSYSYTLYFNNGNLNPASAYSAFYSSGGGNNKREGNSVRCVAHGGDLYDITTMQQMTAEICSNTTTPLVSATEVIMTRSDNTGLIPQTVLIDERDSKPYVVRKLADGNCWMVQNLDLHGGTEINSASSDYTGTAYNLVSSMTSGWNSTGCSTSNATCANDQMYNGEDAWYTDGTTRTTTKPSDEIQALTRSEGAYYSWYTATAKTSLTTADAEATNSICPKGWQLPDGDQTIGSWYHLVTTTYKYASSDSTASSTAGGTTLLNGPLQLNESGSYQGGRAYRQGLSGYYWSSRVNNDSNYFAYNLQLHYDSLTSQGYSWKYIGYSIRCLARQ